MKSFRFAATLLGAACVLSLAGCHTAPEPPRVTVSPDTYSPVGEKSRLFVVETLSGNFGDNGRLFQERFAALARSCQVTVEFFRMPSGDQLSLDLNAETAAARAELKQRQTAFQPDGILEVQTAGWHGPGGLSATPSAPLSYGSFDIKLRLIDSRKPTDQWRASGALNVKAGTGGELLGDRAVQLLATAGVLPHCPK